MEAAIWVAVITGACALASGVLSGVISGRLTIYRVEQLEAKVDKHNGLVERMVVVEQSTKSAHHRINGLEAGK